MPRILTGPFQRLSRGCWNSSPLTHKATRSCSFDFNQETEEILVAKHTLVMASVLTGTIKTDIEKDSYKFI